MGAGSVPALIHSKTGCSFIHGRSKETNYEKKEKKV